MNQRLGGAPRTTNQGVVGSNSARAPLKSMAYSGVGPFLRPPGSGPGVVRRSGTMAFRTVLLLAVFVGAPVWATTIDGSARRHECYRQRVHGVLTTISHTPARNQSHHARDAPTIGRWCRPMLWYSSPARSMAARRSRRCRESASRDAESQCGDGTQDGRPQECLSRNSTLFSSWTTIVGSGTPCPCFF